MQTNDRTAYRPNWQRLERFRQCAAEDLWAAKNSDDAENMDDDSEVSNEYFFWRSVGNANESI